MFLKCLSNNICIEPDELKTKLEYIKKVLNSLPAGNRVILDTIICFLREVSLHTSNCMGVANLAIVFAPNLMRPKEESFESVVAHSSYINQLVMLLIQHYSYLFLDKEYVEEDVDIEAVQLVPLSPNSNVRLKRAKTISSSGSESEEKPLKKKTSNKTNELKKSRKASISESSSKDSLSPREKKSDKKKNKDSNDFMNTLKSDTLKLMTSLMEEKELELIVKEEDNLTPEEKLELEKKLSAKIKETKVNRTKARRVRSLQRNLSAKVGIKKTTKKKQENNKKLSLISEDEEPSLDEKKVRKNKSVDEKSKGKYNTLSKSSGESSNETSTEYQPIVTEEDIKFEEELDELLNSVDDEDIENMKSSLLSSNETSEKTDDSETDNDEELDIKQKIDDVIDKVMEGDMSAFQKYLGEMSRMQRIQRTKSKKHIYRKLNRAQ